jgi:hypothetical protein
MVASIVGQDKAAGNSRFGNRLADGITIGCSSLSATIPAEEQISAISLVRGTRNMFLSVEEVV